MQVVVGSSEAWQLPLDVVALEWKAELWSAGRSASRLEDASAGIRLAVESFTVSEGTVGWCTILAICRVLLSRPPSEVWMRTDPGAL